MNILSILIVLLSFSRSATRAFLRYRRSSHADRIGPCVAEYVGDDCARKIAFLFACKEHEIRPRRNTICGFERAAFEPALRAVEGSNSNRESMRRRTRSYEGAIGAFDRRTDIARGLPRRVEERTLERAIGAKPRFFGETPDALRALREVRRHPIRARAASRPSIARAARIEFGLNGLASAPRSPRDHPFPQNPVRRCTSSTPRTAFVETRAPRDVRAAAPSSNWRVRPLATMNRRRRMPASGTSARRLSKMTGFEKRELKWLQALACRPTR